MKSLAKAHTRRKDRRALTVKGLRRIVVFLLVAWTAACEDSPTAPMAIDAPQFAQVPASLSGLETLVGFEALPGGSGTVSYVENGFRFTGSFPGLGTHNLVSSLTFTVNPFVTRNGMATNPIGTTVTITPEAGGTFDLILFRASQNNFGAKTMVLVGTRPDGSTVSQTFTTNGTSNQTGLETFELDASFTGLVSVSWQSPFVTYDDFQMVVHPGPPQVSADVIGTQGNDAWYVSEVSLDWGIETFGADILDSDGCDPVSITEDQDAVEYTCSVTTEAGTDSESMTIKRDATPPTVDFPGNEGSYDVADLISIGCSATDNLSGVASDTCDGAGVDAEAWTLAMGEHELSAEATDNAGNSGSGQEPFEVSASIGGLSTLVERWVSHAGTVNSLQAKLDNAAKATTANAHDNLLGAFIHEVEAQAGKKIPAEKVAVLIALAQALMS